LVRNPERKRPFGRPRLRREGVVKIYLKEIGLEFVDWIHFTQNRDFSLTLLNSVVNSRRMGNVGCLAGQLLNYEGLRGVT
jgi:hypothetical protein